MSSKTVLITGAAQRIGASIARDLHQYGYDIVVHYHRSTDAAADLTEELNTLRKDSAMCIPGDLLDANCYSNIIDKTFGWKNRLDVLVNNASAFYPVMVNDVTMEQWEELIGTNMKAPFFLSQQAAKYLRPRQGCIINMTDIHADRPLKNHPVYSAAKAGLAMLTQALAKELGPDIRVNAIAPGAILWPADMDTADRDEIMSRSALKKAGKARDVADAVRYLITAADYMTGQILRIDGGRSLYS